MRLSVFVSVLGFLCALPALPQAPAKVGIIHIQNAIMGTADGQKALADLEKRAAPKKKELEGRQQDIIALQDQLTKASNVKSDPEKAKMLQEIEDKKKKFSRDVDDAQADLEQENQKALNEIGNKLLAVLDKYGKDNGYAVILDVSNQQTSPVMFASNSIDVTTDVVNLYNKAGGAAAPPPATSSAPKTPAPVRTAPATTPAATSSVKK